MGLFEKVSNLFYKDEDYEDDEMMEEEEEQEYSSDYRSARRPVSDPSGRAASRDYDYNKKAKKSNMISIPTRGNRNYEDHMEMVLIRAKSYDDMQEIANNIKDEKIVVVNFEDMDKGLAQRMVDFLSGAVFALDGMPKKVSGGTFIFSSSKVDLSGQIMDGGVSFSRFTESRSFSAPEAEEQEEPLFNMPRFFSKK